MEGLYRESCDLAVQWASAGDAPTALACLQQAVAYQRLLGTNFEAEALTSLGVPLDNGPRTVTSHPMPLDSEGRRLQARGNRK